MSTSPAHKDDDAPFAGARRRARERTLGLLYEAELKEVPLAEVLAALPVTPDAYVLALTAAAGQRCEEIDRLIAEHTQDWALDRLPTIDRQLLRLATAELLALPEVPLPVILDEAVELAKSYSTEDSSRFVNGVLSAIARVVRPDEATSA